MIDVVIPAHRKDVDTLDLCIDGIRKNVKNVRRIIVVSKEKLTDKAEFYSEEKFPFSFTDVGDIVGFHRKTFNYYGGLIQTTSALVIPDLERDVLVCDADTIFLKETEFINENDVALYNASYDIPSHVTQHPYLEHMEKLIPGLTKQSRYSGICHHMLIQKDILKEMFERVEKYHNMPFWKADISVTQQEYRCIPSPKPAHDKLPLLFTTYELYFNYVLKFHPERVAIRPQKSILAYKGKMGVLGEEMHSIGSRTNLYGDVHILSKDEESTFSFKNFKDSCEHISKRCAEVGWEAVTFQNHTRIGSKKHAETCVEEVNEILKD
jgi:hypothetical protein|tara:strand:- start:17912 stop:18880 length:969 start_codon:yes stop_codon:yes gene_type:complete